MPVSQPVAPDQIPSGAAPRLFRATGARINPQVEWVEVQVKSVINRVQGMPFKWSINPYRGCEHACVFCIQGETRIQMANGTRKPVSEMRIGDEVYGTVIRGEHRRLVKTRVFAHWETLEPAYHITLEDRTELIASGNHRFLTGHGWKFVSRAGRMHASLAPHDTMVGVEGVTSRKDDLEGKTIGASRRLVSVEPIGEKLRLFDITTGTGDFIANGVISHNCYARLTHWYLDQDGINNWSSRIFVKVNAPEVLRQELGRPSWLREEVNLGTATDPYQPAEGAYKITRQILEALRDYRTPVAIITRSTMVVRDADVLQQLARGPGAMVCFSLSTVDEALARELEPNAPPPLKRLEAMQTLHRAGVPTGLILAPVLPGITDHPRQLGAVIETARKYGASTLWTIPLHLGDVTRQTFFEYLEHKRPQLVPEYERLYRGKYAPASYRRRIQEVVSVLKRRYGFREPPSDRRSPQPGPPPPEQLNLLQPGLISPK